MRSGHTPSPFAGFSCSRGLKIAFRLRVAKCTPHAYFTVFLAPHKAHGQTTAQLAACGLVADSAIQPRTQDAFGLPVTERPNHDSRHYCVTLNATQAGDSGPFGAEYGYRT